MCQLDITKVSSISKVSLKGVNPISGSFSLISQRSVQSQEVSAYYHYGQLNIKKFQLDITKVSSISKVSRIRG